MIRLFEAFAGYGTASFALKELGVEHNLVGFSEIDKYAIKCFEQNHGGKNFGDITKINWSEVPDFDLLTGGFPCQSFSVAGKGLGHLDERGVLANYLTKALIEKQPKYFLFENVKGFMSKKHLEFRETLFKDWRQAGYAITYKVLNTKDFGIPQNRERVWIVGIRKDIKRFGDFVFPEPFELKLKLKDVLEDDVDEKYFLKQEQVDRIELNINKKLPKSDVYDVIATTQNPNAKGTNSRHWVYDDNKSIGSLNATMYKQPHQIVSHSLFPRSSKTGKGGTGHLCKEDGSSYCLDTGNCQAIEKDFEVRRLTPRECFRLQGFLDDRVNLEGLSDTQKYKLAGNGQSVNVVKLLFEALFKQ